MKFLLSLFFVMFSVSSFSQDAVIAVGDAEQEKDKLVIDSSELSNLSSSQKVLANELLDLVRNNFVFYKHKFNTVLYNKSANSYTTENLTQWKEDGINFFIASSIVPASGGVEAG